MLTAEYGGSGGKTIETGLVVEEPDIEIGAGVSSKGKPPSKRLSLCRPPPHLHMHTDKKTIAISRRMATDKGGQQGPRSTRDPPTRDPPTNTTPISRYRQPEVRNDRDQSSIGVSPAVPGFGFQFPGMPNGLPLFPPGFVMPGTAPAQPPPPGAT